MLEGAHVLRNAKEVEESAKALSNITHGRQKALHKGEVKKIPKYASCYLLMVLYDEVWFHQIPTQTKCL